MPLGHAHTTCSPALEKSCLLFPRALFDISLLLCSGFLPPRPSLLPALLHLLAEADPDVAETLAHGLEQRVAERVHADGVDAADAVDLDQVALHARHHGPDVYKGQDGEEDSPDQRQGDAHQSRQQPVAPVLGYGEGGEAGFPDAIEAVGPRRLGDHVLKIYLRREGEREGWTPSSIQPIQHPSLSRFNPASTILAPEQLQLTAFIWDDAPFYGAVVVFRGQI